MTMTNGSRRVLLVEDNADHARLVSHILREKFAWTRSATLSEALALLEAASFDAVLLDLGLPDASGVEGLIELRRRHPEVPVVVVTADGEELGPEALRHGAQDFLVKGAGLFDSLERSVRYAIERARSEAARLRAETRWRAMIETSGEILFELDAEGRILALAGPVERILGHAPSESIGRSYLDFAANGQAASDREAFERLLAGRNFSNYETRQLRPDGREVVLVLNAVPARNGGGLVAGAIGCARDVTEERRSRAELREAHRLLEAVVEGIVDPVFVKDRDRRFVLVNTASARYLGTSREALLGQDSRSFLTGHAGQAIAAADGRILETGTPETDRISLRTAFGDRTFLTTKVPLRGEGGEIRGLIGIARDVTEFERTQEALRRSEEGLLQARKMEAIGRLAGGVAHDFNNLLTAMRGYADLMEEALPRTATCREDLAEIVKAIDRAAALTRQLLAISRKQATEPRSLDLGAEIASLEKILRRTIGEDVLLEISRAPELPRVWMDPGQLSQVVLNLVLNARDAMPQGGTIRVRTCGVRLEEEDVRDLPEARPGEHAVLEVADTGRGMDAEVLSHLCEPFFTTKEVGKGTGLGLPTVHGIVTAAGGHIQVESAPGCGSVFRICLPGMGGPGPEDASCAPPAARPRGNETIVLVEDDDAIRGLLRRFLSSLGYRVLAFRDGKETIAGCAAFAGPIDLLISDVVLPGGNGIEVARGFSAIREGVPVLFMSGYTAGHPVLDELEGRRARLLVKPFSLDSLARTVREFLGAVPGRESRGPGGAPRAGAA